MRRLALLVPLALAFAGCGSAVVESDEIADAAEATIDERSSRIALVGEDEESSGSATGLADYESGRATLVYELASDDGTDRKVTGEVRVIGSRWYGSLDLFGDEELLGVSWVPQGKKWFAMAAEEGASLGTLVLGGSLYPDPAKLLNHLTVAAGDVERLQDGQVRRVAVRGYGLELDLAKLVERAPAERRASLREELEDRDSKVVPMELWIDDEGRVRRLHVDDSEEGVLTVDFFDFGVDVDIEAPPANEVVDFDELLHERVGDYEDDIEEESSP